ncbi:hypothetical protein BV22DRAFT_1178048 [Leucogyrophana mollusca]|uniref:Uncharacterized protein n=1 Tax=Leucogyrophana mollusca TaxID=85980 RepID=A0ACB8B6B8_9AGAM|nr:hypothetical protein BV22DRAFT_1178048 [Leucogyrophana mollusca]
MCRLPHTSIRLTSRQCRYRVTPLADLGVVSYLIRLPFWHLLLLSATLVRSARFALAGSRSYKGCPIFAYRSSALCLHLHFPSLDALPTNAMSSTYEHFFWTVAIDNADTSAEPVDIGVAKRAQLRKAALDLNTIPSVILATAEGGTAAVHPEICLLLAVEDRDIVDEYAAHIAKALATHGLDAKLTLQEETRFYEFDETEVKRVRACQCIPSGEDEKAKIYRLIETAETLPLPDPNAVNSSSNGNNSGGNGASGYGGGGNGAGGFMFTSANTANTAPQQGGPESFTITAEKYEELKNAKGDKLRDSIKNLYDTIYGLRDERKNSSIITRLAAAGIVTVGVAMYIAYKDLVEKAIASGVAYTAGTAFAFSMSAVLIVGGPVTLAVSIVAGGMVALYLLWKDAMNILLLANDSDFDLTFTADEVANGRRCSVVTTIPAMTKAHSTLGYPALYPCGAFVYQKARPSSPIAYAVMLNFSAEDSIPVRASKGGQTDRVSVGMDSPNSAFGGSNSIFVTGYDAKKAADGAHNGNAEEDTAQTSHGRITGRRANKWGPINYGFAFYTA